MPATPLAQARYTARRVTLWQTVICGSTALRCICIRIRSALSVKYPGKEPPTSRLAINHEILCAEAFWTSLKKRICCVRSHEMMPRYSVTKRSSIHPLTLLQAVLPPSSPTCSCEAYYVLLVGLAVLLQ